PADRPVSRPVLRDGVQLGSGRLTGTVLLYRQLRDCSGNPFAKRAAASQAPDVRAPTPATMNGLRACPWVLPCVLIGAVCGDLEAQSAQPFSLQASGLVNGVFGDVFTGLQDGIGAEAQFRYTPGALSVGAGFQ